MEPNTSLGSDLGMEPNASAFRCISLELNATNITNSTVWMLRIGLEGRIPVAIIEIIFFLIGFFWNLFIVVTYLVKYRLIKEPANIFLFDLALNDLLICIFLLPINIVTLVANEYIFGFNDPTRCNVCFANGFLVTFFALISLHGLALLSMDRFLLLSKPMWYKKNAKWWKAVLLVCSIWVISFVLALPPVFGFGEWEFNMNFGTCLPRWAGTRPNGTDNIYYMAVVLGEALIPVIILAVTNIWTYKIVKSFLKRRHRRRSLYQGREQEDKKLKKEELQLVKVFGALFIANLISWTLLFLVFVVIFITTQMDHPDVVPPWVYTIGWLCFLTTPVVHPIIESFFIKELRYQVHRARQTVRKASQSLIRVATSTFSDIPEDVNESDEQIPRYRRYSEPVQRTSSSSPNTTQMTDISEPRQIPRTLSESLPKDTIRNSTPPKMSAVNGHLAQVQDISEHEMVVAFHNKPLIVLKTVRKTSSGSNKHVTISLPDTPPVSTTSETNGDLNSEGDQSNDDISPV